MQVRATVGYDVDDNQSHALPKICETFGNKRLAVFRTVLVRWADQFDRTHEDRCAFVTEYEGFDNVGDNRQTECLRRLRAVPDSRPSARSRIATFLYARMHFLEGGNVNFNSVLDVR